MNGNSDPGVRGLRGVRIRVPATSANLGPGFDTLGLALDVHDEVIIRRTEAGVSVEVTGEGAHCVPRDATHLVVQAALAAFHEMDVEPPGLALQCRNRIPHGRGLGSSAGAIVAGVLAARAMIEAGAERLPDDAVVRLTAGLEGHPDNVSACLLGGLTVAWTGSAGPQAVRLEPHPDVVPLLAVPPSEMSTKAARALLPAVVPHEDATGNAGRAALLVTALTERPDLLLDATEDRLHQEYRAPGMPQTLALVRDLRRHGLAATVSGAGPSVIVLTVRGDADASLDLVAEAVPAGWDVRRLQIDRRGAVVDCMDV